MNPSLMKLKLLDVLRNNDSTKLLDLIQQIDSEPTNYDLAKLKNELLLFAVQVGPLSITKFIIENDLVDINTQDSEGNTALHLAAISNRNDIIEYLLHLPLINDCIYNNNLKQPVQCTTNPQTIQLMEYLRNKHIEKIASQLRQGFESRNFDLLDKLLNNQRDKELLDINGTDPITGDTVLIEFVKKDDYDMVKFILNHGGDPFKRSLSGKLPEESTTNLQMKLIIEESFNKQNIMESIAHPQEGSPTCKGFLKKWTNFAGGYKLRWFVLDNEARLSYYKSPNDMNNTCRGLIHLAHAMLRVDSSENTKFEIIIQNPSDGSPVRWHLKAEHSTEAQKWIWVLQNAIRYAKDNLKKQRKSVMLSHILNEDLPNDQRQPQPSIIFEDDESPEQIQFHSRPITPSSIHIPESYGLDDTLALEGHKSVSSILLEKNPHDDNYVNGDNENNNNDDNDDNDDNINNNDVNDDDNNNVDSNDDSNNNNNNNVNNDNDVDDYFSDHSFNSNYEPNTNISPRLSIDSLRNQMGPAPDRTSQYGASTKQHPHAESGHNRAPSISSQKSSSSERSKNPSLAKKIYKAPLKQLSKIGRKTRNSFVVDYEKQPSDHHHHQRDVSSQYSTKSTQSNNTNNNHNSNTINSNRLSYSNASFASNASTMSSPDIRGNNEFEQNFDESAVANNDDDDDDNDDDDDGNFPTEKNANPSTDLYVVRNQISIQLKTFKDFLDSSLTDNSMSKDDLVQMSNSILATLNILVNQEGGCINSKYNDLLKRLEKQQKISSIWENSIKQLEMEIRERETKIVELEDKLKALKRALRNSVSQLQQNHVTRALPGEQEPATATSAASLARQALTANMSKNVPPIPSSAPPFDVVRQQQEEQRALQRQHEIQQRFATPSDKKNVLTPVAQPSSVELNKEPSYATQPAPFDPALAEFIEESDDSEDEFFDAEESDVVRDMSILERRETIKTRKNRLEKEEREREEHAKKLHEHPEKPKEIEHAAVEQFKQVPPAQPIQPIQPISNIPGSTSQYPVPTELPPPIPQQQENKIIEKDLSSPEESSIQQSETSEAVNIGTSSNNVTSKPEFEKPEPNYKPNIDGKGRYVVNKRELISNVQNERYDKILEDQSFEGYEDPLRLSLAPEDNRPKISLWGVLKSLVGKDMTKMTLPVTFNEPTSLLQRNVEVIEYSDLLDRAASMEASTLRLVYVATFAASEYASTVGRIAKPFNPLLGETFEYTRSDKGYRCFVEQVSHHPPISALVAESPRWSYYGESNVKTKFLGRSFDIKHLGTWFCEIYPDSGVECKNGQKSDKEVYSWKKVNNSVIGIIVGNPTIDNYGDMEIHNHMTGDYMKFSFKPRGWRASSAYEVKGEVFNAQGKLVYYVGGHWNSKIFCKPADDKNAERFLVWEAAPRKEMMFHLTNFAATLNAPLPHLLPKVACTDTRLRPDQRAMEDGDYDLASEEKNRVEEKQREVRRQRELKGEVYKPYFFERSNHPITGEEYWKYEGTYWRERMEGKLKDYNNIF